MKNTDAMRPFLSVMSAIVLNYINNNMKEIISVGQ